MIPLFDYAKGGLPVRNPFAGGLLSGNWLEANCRRWAAMHTHPGQKEVTVAQALKLGDPRSSRRWHRSTTSTKARTR